MQQDRLNQLLHSLHAIQNVFDKFVAVFVQFPIAIFGQQTREALYSSERFLQIVRSDFGELVQFFIALHEHVSAFLNHLLHIRIGLFLLGNVSHECTENVVSIFFDAKYRQLNGKLASIFMSCDQFLGSLQKVAVMICKKLLDVAYVTPSQMRRDYVRQILPEHFFLAPAKSFFRLSIPIGD